MNRQARPFNFYGHKTRRFGIYLYPDDLEVLRSLDPKAMNAALTVRPSLSRGADHLVRLTADEPLERFVEALPLLRRSLHAKKRNIEIPETAAERLFAVGHGVPSQGLRLLIDCYLERKRLRAKLAIDAPPEYPQPPIAVRARPPAPSKRPRLNSKNLPPLPWEYDPKTYGTPDSIVRERQALLTARRAALAEMGGIEITEADLERLPPISARLAWCDDDNGEPYEWVRPGELEAWRAEQYEGMDPCPL